MVHLDIGNKPLGIEHLNALERCATSTQYIIGQHSLDFFFKEKEYIL